MQSDHHLPLLHESLYSRREFLVRMSELHEATNVQYDVILTVFVQNDDTGEVTWTHPEKRTPRPVRSPRSPWVSLRPNLPLLGVFAEQCPCVDCYAAAPAFAAPSSLRF